MPNNRIVYNVPFSGYRGADGNMSHDHSTQLGKHTVKMCMIAASIESDNISKIQCAAYWKVDGNCCLPIDNL